MSNATSNAAPSSKPSPRERILLLAKKLLPLALAVAVGVVLVALVGVAQRSGWLPSSKSGAGQSSTTGAIYTCPMHPQIRQPNPGRCPICGMALVPAASAVADINALAVKIEPAQRRLANIQTAKVESGPLEATLQTVGAIAIDESRQATIAAYIEGRLERLFADYTGVEIKNGDHLAVIYSPQLFAAQVEYVEARRAFTAAAAGLPAVRQAQESLMNNTRQRLREFGMTDEQLAELEKTGNAQSRLTIYSPQSGTVVEKFAVEGNYVKAGDPIYRIAELSTVWLLLELFPEDAARVRFGQHVEAVAQSLPGEKLRGRVAFIDPIVNPKTRTVRVRAELLNDGRLRPGDYAEATVTLPIGPRGQVYDAELAGKWISPMHPQIIRDAPGECPICGMALAPTSRYGFADQPVPLPVSRHVPRLAVLMAGGNSVVYVETKPGLFEIRPVTLGPILRDKIVILDGLKEGELVATAGNFLIDSQMQLAGKPSLLDPLRTAGTKRARGQPLALPTVAVRSIGGDTGMKVEKLYATYLEIHQTLAADRKPSANAAHVLHETASALLSDTALATSHPAALAPLREIAAKSEHLHHLELSDARGGFKTISKAILMLATQLRGTEATGSFTHFYCEMVPGGEGDWLQGSDELLNPYFGAAMLRCGQKVRALPAKGAAAEKVEVNPQDASEAKTKTNPKSK